jgi:hypothetical protein
MNQVNMSVITSCLTGNEDDQHKAMQQVALMLVAVASKFCELDHVCSLSGIHYVLHRVKCVRWLCNRTINKCVTCDMYRSEPLPPLILVQVLSPVPPLFTQSNLERDTGYSVYYVYIELL